MISEYARRFRERLKVLYDTIERHFEAIVVILFLVACALPFALWIFDLRSPLEDCAEQCTPYAPTLVSIDRGGKTCFCETSLRLPREEE